MNDNKLTSFLFKTNELEKVLPLTFRFLESGKKPDNDPEDVKLVCFNEETKGNVYSLRFYKPISRLISLK